MTSIPQLRRDINDLRAKTKAELIEAIERDRDVVKRARQAHADLAHEVERRAAAERECARLKAAPPKEVVREVTKRVEVPTPDPAQAREIERLRARLKAAPKEVVREVTKRVEVPTPDPAQAQEVERLRAALAHEVERREAAEREASRLKATPPDEVVRNRDVVKRARQAHADLAHEMKRRAEAESEIARLKAMPPKEVVREVPKRIEVPTPDPAQAREIERLRAALAAIPKADIVMAKKWRAMVEKQNGDD